MKTFNKYKKNIYSQNGEDGVIEELLKRLNINSGWFVEFGAWDGIKWSNTYNLLSKGWYGLDIEGSKKRFKDLIKTSRKWYNLRILNTMVKIDGPNSLDNILTTYKFKEDFELLSIDIDSYDYLIWDSLKKYKPKIVIIEINSRIPCGKEINNNSSFTAMLNLGRKKGYTLIMHTGNMIFVRDDLINQIGLTDKELSNPEILFCNKYTTLMYKIKRFIWLFWRKFK